MIVIDNSAGSLAARDPYQNPPSRSGHGWRRCSPMQGRRASPRSLSAAATSTPGSPRGQRGQRRRRRRAAAGRGRCLRLLLRAAGGEPHVTRSRAAAPRRSPASAPARSATARRSADAPAARTARRALRRRRLPARPGRPRGATRATNRAPVERAPDPDGRGPLAPRDRRHAAAPKPAGPVPGHRPPPARWGPLGQGLERGRQCQPARRGPIRLVPAPPSAWSRAARRGWRRSTSSPPRTPTSATSCARTRSRPISASRSSAPTTRSSPTPAPASSVPSTPARRPQRCVPAASPFAARAHLPGSVQRPCGTRPLRPDRFRRERRARRLRRRRRRRPRRPAGDLPPPPPPPPPAAGRLDRTAARADAGGFLPPPESLASCRRCARRASSRRAAKPAGRRPWTRVPGRGETRGGSRAPRSRRRLRSLPAGRRARRPAFMLGAILLAASPATTIRGGPRARPRPLRRRRPANQAYERRRRNTSKER